MGASCWMRPLFVYTDNNFLKRGRSPLIFRFLFLYLPRISEKGVPCANAMAEIIPNEPDTDHAGVGIFLSVLFIIILSIQSICTDAPVLFSF